MISLFFSSANESLTYVISNSFYADISLVASTSFIGVISSFTYFSGLSTSKTLTIEGAALDSVT
jgi:hypothetical protein